MNYEMNAVTVAAHVRQMECHLEAIKLIAGDRESGREEDEVAIGLRAELARQYEEVDRLQRELQHAKGVASSIAGRVKDGRPSMNAVLIALSPARGSEEARFIADELRGHGLIRSDEDGHASMSDAERIAKHTEGATDA